MFNKILKIDDIDKQIITLLQENPDLTHADISEKIHKSQPAVGARIIKLKRRHLLETQIGINYKEIDLKIAKVEMLVKNASEFVEKLTNCPFVLHAFRISGNTNVMTLIASPDLTTVDKMVDVCFRSDPNVMTVNVSYIISTLKDLILPLNFDIENFDDFSCGKSCIARNGDLDKIRNLIKSTKNKSNNNNNDKVKEESEDSVDVDNNE